ncbi:DUF4160 domain-containing protein [Mycoplana sp. MJR14]|uniref:DUF4160 domain-containing protein n=1 Tax=Mycoplana sp. MJR14 TaxID=3032583 RepID=UPI000DD595D5|nr:DUF4160 domain-containing protein [Mycoplana sp. MJR14]MDF1634754.1 DUF4160 domain-containing protein [Mycoplana sp. MJR14]
MPVVLRIGKFVFFFYSNEGDPREPVHIHVRSSGAEAKVWLDPAIGIADSRGFNAKELSAIIRHVIDNRETIRSAWNEHFGD